MKYNLCKRICVLVILTVYIFQLTYATTTLTKDNDNNETIQQQENDDENSKNKTKRGIFYVGRGLPNTYASIYGYQTPLLASPFVKTFGATAPAASYVIRPGGAAVTSYNVNYLRYPYYNPRTFGGYYPFSSVVSPTLPASSLYPGTSVLPTHPEVSTAPLAPVAPSHPIFPTHSFVPIHPVAPAHPVVPAHPIVPTSPVVPTHPVVPSHPIHPVFPAAPAPAPVPIPTNTFFIPHRPVVPLPATPQRPVLVPSATGPFPSVIPIQPGPTTSIPSTVVTPTTSTITPTSPSYPSHHGQPWRPIYHPPSTNSHHHHHGIHRPAISLLPPYEGTSHKANIENLQSLSPSREYLFPSLQRQQLLAAAFQSQQHLLEQQQQQLQQQQEQQEQQQQSDISNQVEDFDQQSNYFGLSSYDVPLHGNKGYNY